MPRYNTITSVTTISSASTIPTPQAGLFTSLTGSAPYTVILANPSLFTGFAQNLYNATNGTITLAAPSGNIRVRVLQLLVHKLCRNMRHIL